MAWPSGREELIEVQLKIASQVAAPWSLPAGWSTTPDRASELVQRCLGRERVVAAAGRGPGKPRG